MDVARLEEALARSGATRGSKPELAELLDRCHDSDLGGSGRNAEHLTNLVRYVWSSWSLLQAVTGTMEQDAAADFLSQSRILVYPTYPEALLGLLLAGWRDRSLAIQYTPTCEPMVQGKFLWIPQRECFRTRFLLQTSPAQGRLHGAEDPVIGPGGTTGLAEVYHLCLTWLAGGDYPAAWARQVRIAAGVLVVGIPLDGPARDLKAFQDLVAYATSLPPQGWVQSPEVPTAGRLRWILPAQARMQAMDVVDGAYPATFDAWIYAPAQDPRYALTAMPHVAWSLQSSTDADAECDPTDLIDRLFEAVLGLGRFERPKVLTIPVLARAPDVLAVASNQVWWVSLDGVVSLLAAAALIPTEPTILTDDPPTPSVIDLAAAGWYAAWIARGIGRPVPGSTSLPSDVLFLRTTIRAQVDLADQVNSIEVLSQDQIRAVLGSPTGRSSFRKPSPYAS